MGKDEDPGRTGIYDRWDQFMSLLSAQPRRQIIASLIEAPDGARLSLPDAAINPDISINREQYEIDLRHRHLPLLAEADYVRWRSDPFQVWRGLRFEEPAGVMRALVSADDHLPPPLRTDCIEDPAQS